MPKNVTVYTSMLTRPSDLVKARFTALGPSQGDVAAEAGMSRSLLSSLIMGHRRNPAAQQMVVHALRRLTGCKAVTRKYLFGERS